LSPRFSPPFLEAPHFEKNYFQIRLYTNLIKKSTQNGNVQAHYPSRFTARKIICSSCGVGSRFSEIFLPTFIFMERLHKNHNRKAFFSVIVLLRLYNPRPDKALAQKIPLKIAKLAPVHNNHFEPELVGKF